MRRFFRFVLTFFLCLLSFKINAIDFVSSSAFIVPSGVEQLSVHVWGAGGGGGGAYSTILVGPDSRAGGGGGGAYARKVIDVTPGQTYTVTVGTGGQPGNFAGSNGGNGGSSSFSGNGVNIVAAGGIGGGGASDGDGVGGAGGSIGGSSGDFVFAGGNGADGTAAGSGGGGGGAGSEVQGGNAITTTGGTGGANGGGDGANGRAGFGSGADGTAPGGGGSGAYAYFLGSFSGGRGARGFIRVLYDVTPIGITKDKDLQFGKLINAGAGSVQVAADSGGNRTKTGATILVGNNVGCNAEFTVTGANQAFIADFLNPPAALLNGGNSLPLSLSIGYQNRSSANNSKVYVGGTITLTGSEPPGVYSANATIAVSYE